MPGTGPARGVDSVRNGYTAVTDRALAVALTVE